MEKISGDSNFIEVLKGNIDLKEKRTEIKTPNIELRNVNTVYEGERFPTLNDISINFTPGEFVFITGPNGTGKTTILETILGMLPIQTGDILVKQQDIQKKGNKIRKSIGYLIQGLDFEPDTTYLVKDVVMIGRTGKIGILRRPKKRDWEIARLCLQNVGMEQYWNHPIGKLSGGQQQKVLIASALAGEPEILLLDEPFSALDVNALQDMFGLFSNLNTYAGTTILCVSHSSGIPKNVDRVIMLNEGRIALDSPRSRAIENPKYKAFMEFYEQQQKHGEILI